ncbi:MAG TPA: lasso peptide biosynthesis B2 protein [Verrucomicrobiae bacterium]|nr:lasso peptide biosynthesis B2 protein [Verrucomicrobiae bacterium]
MVKTWRAFWQLNGLERGIALEAAAGLMASWVGLRLVRFSRWKRLMEWFTPPAGNSEESRGLELAAQARAIARLEAGVARRIFLRTNCLEQALALWWVLKRQGIPGELRIGGRKEGGRFEAHAWVEFAGETLDVSGEAHLHFVPFDGPLESLETKAH